MRVDELLAGPMVQTILVRLAKTWRCGIAMVLIRRWRITLVKPDHLCENCRNGAGANAASIYGMRHKKQNQQTRGLAS
jgi:hypothetical protein